jgi:NAD(P)-dependent dehydrogenase (short-subunit alcohol dehydrogenase family)
MRGFVRDQWALVLGGSSGIGLAAGDKLSRHGMSVCIVHRDRRGAMPRIQPAFDAIASRGVGFCAFNIDGLSGEGRDTVLAGLAEAMGSSGRVRVFLHSIACGNLKLLVPGRGDRPQAARARLAQALGVDAASVREAVTRLFAEGDPSFADLADPPAYNQDNILEDEDLARTAHAMGTSLIGWVQAIHVRLLFAPDARVFGLTSEGNRAAFPAYAAISVAKAALEAAARAIAVEYAPYGVRCNILQPGATRTAAFSLIPGSDHIAAAALLKNPMGRLTTPEDVAGVICLLSTDEAGWVNGALIAVDGGERLGG